MTLTNPDASDRVISGVSAPPEIAFAEVVTLIEAARRHSYQAVNTTLIALYWQVGAYMSAKLEAAEWGDGVVEQLARHLAQSPPGLQGFTRRNLFRMRRFYDTYRDDIKVSALLTQLPWTHNLIILGQSKRAEEREFYLRTAIQQKWSSRELERQFKAALFERTIIEPVKASITLGESHPEAREVFKDSYLVEFLDLAKVHDETDLHDGLLTHLKDFLLEMGRDFCFAGANYPVQVGGRDFALDLLFFHRGLNCLIAIELKVTCFEPEYLGKLSFYLEALDRDHRKEHENPAIGVMLCASKDDEVVEYALSRTLSPALVAKYQTQLPDKKLLQAKLREFYALDVGDGRLP